MEFGIALIDKKQVASTPRYCIKPTASALHNNGVSYADPKYVNKTDYFAQIIMPLSPEALLLADVAIQVNPITVG